MERRKDQWARKRRSPIHEVVRAFVEPQLNFINSIVSLKNKKILDVGCGNGYFTYHFNTYSKNVFGMDSSPAMIKMNPYKNIAVGDAENIHYRNKSFDIVFCSNLLHHVKSVDKVISEMKRTSRKWVIISEPNRNNLPIFLFSLIKKEERGALKFSLNYLVEKCKKQKLNIVNAISTGLVYPNKTPRIMLKFVKRFDKNIWWGVSNLIITKKL